MPNQIRRTDAPACRHARRAVVGKRRRGRPLLLLLGAFALPACSPTEPPFVGQVAALESDRTLVVERRDGTLSASNTDTGDIRWRVRPLPEPAPGFVTVPTRHLVCPMERTRAGTLLLRYHTRLVAIDVLTGELLWERKLVGWATDEQRCPRAAADSGVLLLRGNGLFLQKLDTKGNDEWLFAMERLGAALAPVEVVMPSGDALVRTRSFLASVNPKGELGWAQER